MMMPFRKIFVPLLAILAMTGCDSIQRQIQPSEFAIQQITPDTIRADKPTTLTITGSGFEGVEEVRFGFRKHSEEIDTVEDFTTINANTLEVVTPVLPGLDENARVWVSVGRTSESDGTTSVLDSIVGTADESLPVAITFRPPNVIDLYGMYALMVAVGFVALMIVLAFIQRGFRRIAYRRELLEAKGRRLALRDERRARIVLAEIAAEKEAAQAKLEAEFLPYADQASGSDTHQ